MATGMRAQSVFSTSAEPAAFIGRNPGKGLCYQQPRPNWATYHAGLSRLMGVRDRWGAAAVTMTAV
jgi:hypothetical protein